MKLPEFITSFLPQQTKMGETYLALELLDNGVKALAWQLVNDKITILNEKVAEFRGEDEEEKIRVCDLVISQVEEKLPENQTLSKVVFGLSEKTVVASKIVSPMLSFLKKLCQELSLTPVGFVVINEAIIHFLKQEEGVPPTVLLVNFTGNNLSCALVKMGKIEMVKHQAQVENVAETLGLIFREFNVEVLPSRILLYDTFSSLEQLRQELISYPWLSKANFLHFPKFEILGKNEDVKAVAYAGSSELLAKEVHFEEEAKQEDTDKKKEEIEKTEEKKPEEPGEETKPTDITELGFVKDQDILELRKKETAFEGEYFKEEKESDISKSNNISKPEEELQKAIPKPLTLPSLNIKAFLDKISLPKFSLPNISLPSFLPEDFSGKTPLLFSGLAILIVLSILGWFYWTLPKAKVTLVVSPQILEKEADVIIRSGLIVFIASDIIATSSSGIDEINSGISGKLITVSENTSGKSSATGKKITGDKAKGQVTIYNKTENQKTLSKGIIITSPAGIKFTLDNDVVIASTSAFATSFSSVVANVTASQIGTEGNLPFGANFTIADYPTSSYFARNDNAFSGGTSRTVQAVSKEDQEKLLSSLSSQLLDKAKQEFSSKSNMSERIIEETVKKVITKKAFSAAEGSETSQFSLDLAMDFTALSYNENDVKSLLEKVIKDAIPGDFSYQAKNASFTTKLKDTKKDGSALVTVVFTAKLLPKIDLDQVKKKLAGQSIAKGKKYLLGLSSVSDAQFSFSPQLPGFLLSFPHLAKNITLEIVSQ